MPSWTGTSMIVVFKAGRPLISADRGPKAVRPSILTVENFRQYVYTITVMNYNQDRPTSAALFSLPGLRAPSDDHFQSRPHQCRQGVRPGPQGACRACHGKH